jgi:probable RNA-binding protein EIF1AD
MSQSTKRKHVTKEVLDEFRLPSNNERIVRVLAGRGNNLHEVYDPNSFGVTAGSSEALQNKYLVSMPPKFRKNVWIKRGDYVVVDPIVEGDKVKAEIVQILYKDQIKYIKQEGLWPSKFSEEGQNSEDSKTGLSTQSDKKSQQSNALDIEHTSEDESDDETDLFQNTNQTQILRWLLHSCHRGAWLAY